MAGRWWLLTARDGPEVDAALAAVGERHGGDPVGILHALPVRAPLAAYPPPAQLRLEELRAGAAARGHRWEPPTPRRRSPRRSPPPNTRLENVLGCAVLTAMVAPYVVGLVTMVRWLRRLDR